MKRILHIIGGLDRGGAESFLMNAWRNIDHKKYQFDILTFIQPRDGKKFAFEDELIKGGAKIYRVKDNRVKAPWRFEKDVAKIVKEGNYEIVHSHIDFMSALSLKGAKMGGAKYRISHSHSTFNDNLYSPVKKFASSLMRRRLNRLVTKRLACGINAGEFLYGKNQEFTVIKNGIDAEKFYFNADYRKELRSKYKLNNKTKVILNVGRLEEVKNQAWLIDVFDKVFKEQPDSALFIIGDGSLKESLKEKVNGLASKKQIFILDSQPDINKYYSMADIFALPSKFEGVPTVGIEAQASGLPCFFSVFVPKETKISDNAKFLEIDSDKDWVKEFVNTEVQEKRNASGSKIDKYDIHNSVKKLEEIYDSF